MSPGLFNYYIELILRALGEERGLNVGGQNITNVICRRYCFTGRRPSETSWCGGYRQWEELLRIINKLEEDRMYVSKKKEAPRWSLKGKVQIIRQVSSLNYLGSTITEDSRCGNEIKRRISKGPTKLSQNWRAFSGMQHYDDQDSLTSTQDKQQFSPCLLVNSLWHEEAWEG